MQPANPQQTADQTLDSASPRDEGTQTLNPMSPTLNPESVLRGEATQAGDTQSSGQADQTHTGLMTTLTPEKQQSAPAALDPDLVNVPVESKDKVFPGLNDPAPTTKRWQSKTTRRVLVEIKPESCVFVREPDGSVSVFERDAFMDKFAAVTSRKRIVDARGVAVEVLLTEPNGLIVLNGSEVLAFETRDAAKVAGYVVD